MRRNEADDLHKQENGCDDEELAPEFIDRPTSAPPNLEINRGFTFYNSVLDSASIFNADIRAHPMYEKFYFQVNDPTLPPPLSFLSSWPEGYKPNEYEYSLFGKVSF